MDSLFQPELHYQSGGELFLGPYCLGIAQSGSELHDERRMIQEGGSCRLGGQLELAGATKGLKV